MEKSICILPIGNIDDEILHYAQKKLEEELNVKVVIGETLEYPKYAYSKEREQYHSTLILKRIGKIKMPDCDRVLGIVDVDLYVPELTFVFGEAEIIKQVAVISLTRLKQEYYGLPKDDILFKRRIITEAIHELGHTYRLRHCKNKDCVMFFSNTLDDTDQKGSFFCDTCERKLIQEKRPES